MTRKTRPGLVNAAQFRPDSATSMYDPVQRLAELSQQMRDNPGRAVGGSGSTGLLRNDAAGWRTMLQDQKEYAALQAYLNGQGPLDEAVAPDQSSTRTLTPATGQNNRDAFGLPGWMSGSTLDAVKAKLPNSYDGILSAYRGRQF